MPFLDTKTRIAFVETTNEWCPVSLQLVFLEALEKHTDSMQSDGLLRGEFANRGPPPFLIRKTKLRVPKLDKISTNDAEFINYFERLCYCNVMEVADADWEWMKMLLDHFTLAGKMKQTISRQATVLELPHGPQSSSTEIRFLKSLKMQILYNHYFCMSDLTKVVSLDYPIRVEVDPRYETPFKKTTLCRELMCMRHPPAVNGMLGNMFINSAHSVQVGPERGHVRILYHNDDANEAYVEQFQTCFASHTYMYLRNVRHYSLRCLQKLVMSWF